MQLRISSLKFINKQGFTAMMALAGVLTAGNAQEVINDEKEAAVQQIDSVKPTMAEPIKVDGVAAVVGDYVVLDSDIDKEFKQLQASGASMEGIDKCQLFGSLLEKKLYAHHAVQDSIEVSDVEIRGRIDQQLNSFLEQIGSMEKLLAYYKKDDEKSLRDEMFEINKGNQLAFKMQQKIVEELEVTPEEVRQFYNDIPKEERPIFGTELKVAQIVVIPEISDKEEQKVIDRLAEFRSDVLDNGASFTTKAVLYSDDTGSKREGGKYTINKKRPQFVKEFRDIAFSLQEGEISDPFKTEFGFHIILLEKIRGQEYDVRHILLRPEITNDAIAAAKKKIETARTKILSEEMTFADAARMYSDEKETKFDGGLFRNPSTQDYSFELTKMDPELYAQIEKLKNNEVSAVFDDADRTNRVKFKILTVADRLDEHEADFAKDYLKIKELALEEKQLDAIREWQEKKILDTYIKLNGANRDCSFTSNWLKK
jgi:peptidyl-prolyl cis-trans isomerase SurA